MLTERIWKGKLTTPTDSTVGTSQWHIQVILEWQEEVYIRAMATENRPGVDAVLADSGVSASQPCTAKTTAVLLVVRESSSSLKSQADPHHPIIL